MSTEELTEALTKVISRRLSWASLHWFRISKKGGIRTPVISDEVALALAEAIVGSGWLAEYVCAREAKALRTAADEMDNTDDPDAIHVDNGDIDVWLRARADRIEQGGPS